MTANRAFSLLLWIGVSGVGLLVAGGVRLALGAWPDDGNLHEAIDGVCVIAPTHGDIVSHGLSYGAVVLLIGVVGLALRQLGIQAVASRTLRHDLARAVKGASDEHLRHAMDAAGITDDVFLLPSRRRMAFTAGIWRPSIFVTTGLITVLTSEQLEAVLLHEEFHRKGRDPLRAVVARALATALFFLPILRELGGYYEVSKEVEADAGTIRQQGTRTHIASALYRLGGSDGLASMGAVGFNEAASVEARIDAMSAEGWKGTPFGASTAKWSMAGVVLLLALIAQPLTAAQSWWAVALSLAACPAWLLLFWMHQRRSQP